METPTQTGGRVLQTSLIIDEDPYLLRRKDILAHVNQLFSALAEDNCAEFLSVAKDRRNLVCEGRSSYLIAPSLLLRWAIEHRALECAKMLLEGKGGHDLKADADSRQSEMSPIHLAAAYLLPDFVELFLKHGAPVDITCLYHPADFYSLLPLDTAVKKLSEKILWTPAQSVYRLIFTLCDTMELEQGFRTISQLMSASSLEQNRKAFYDYAREEKILELSIFLYVDAISEFGIFKSMSYDEHLALHQSLAPNSSLHSKEERHYVVDGNRFIESTGKNRVLMSLLLLLQIFHQTNFSMLGFDATCEVLANRIKDAGFDLISGDLQNLGNNVAATQVVKHKKMSGRVLPGVPFNILSSCPWSKSPWYFHEARGKSSVAQTFQSSQRFESKSMPMLFNQKDAQAGAEKAISLEGPLAVSCSLRKMWHIFFSAIRRRIV